jgi:hypothetical protein
MANPKQPAGAPMTRRNPFPCLRTLPETSRGNAPHHVPCYQWSNIRRGAMSFEVSQSMLRHRFLGVFTCRPH